MRILRLLRALALLAVLGWFGSWAPAAAGPLDDFDGSWEGQITFLKIVNQFQPNEAPLWMRLVIDDDDVHVYCCNDRHEVKPGDFTIDSHGSNAVIYAINSDEGVWTETWNFTVTLRGDDTMDVVFSRAVNNVKVPLSNPQSKFTTMGYGRFSRVK